MTSAKTFAKWAPYLRLRKPKEIIAITFEDGTTIDASEDEIRRYLRCLDIKREDEFYKTTGLPGEHWRMIWIESEIERAKSNPTKHEALLAIAAASGFDTRATLYAINDFKESARDAQPRDAQLVAARKRTDTTDAAVGNIIKALVSKNVPKSEWVSEIHEALRRNYAERWHLGRKRIKALVADRHGITLPRQRKRKLAR